ncbi:hypothetical protein N431DRAFT_445193 [Stipitochalara longipes BDJ]|nr:hypothetical protein N431DRAFT_445193 [Stipitochalara longipes BDJ]
MMFSPASLLTALAFAAAGVQATFDVAIFSQANCGGNQFSELHLAELGDCAELLVVEPGVSWKVLNAPGVTCQAFTTHDTTCDLSNDIFNPVLTTDSQGNFCGTPSRTFGSLICA